MSEASEKKLRLVCPICETRLKVSEGIAEFACLNCGTELRVVMVDGVPELEPTEAAAATLTPEELELSQLNTTLKSKEDAYGVGCAVATLGITMIACVGILIANLFNSPVLFGIVIGLALVLLAVVLALFIIASNRGTAPILRRRDRLQTTLAQTEPPTTVVEPKSSTPEQPEAAQ